MGLATGFLEIERKERSYEKIEQRLKNYNEFVLPMPLGRGLAAGRALHGLRHPVLPRPTGCPVNNHIPDWNELVYAGDRWKDALEQPALDQQLPGVHRPHLPGAVRGVVHAEHRRQPGRPSSRSNARSSIAAGRRAGSGR